MMFPPIGSCLTETLSGIDKKREMMQISSCTIHGGYSSTVERQIVVLVVAGSNPVTHPTRYASVAQLDRAPDFESVGRRFESCRTYYSLIIGPLAQLGEQQTLNLRVEGSIPSRLNSKCALDEEGRFVLITARVVKLADTPDLGSGAERRKGSSPFSRKEKGKNQFPARVAQR